MKKVCSKCKIEKELTEFSKDKNRKGGVYIQCKECQKAYREAYKEKKKEYNKAYSKTEAGKKSFKKYYQSELGKEAFRRVSNKRRALKRNISHLGNYTKQDLEQCRSFFNNCCAYSGEPLKGNEEIEHIIPLSKGGTNNPNNIVLATKEVNRAKSANKDWVSWYRKQPYYKKTRENKIKEWIKLKSQINLFEAI